MRAGFHVDRDRWKGSAMYEDRQCHSIGSDSDTLYIPMRYIF